MCTFYYKETMLTTNGSETKNKTTNRNIERFLEFKKPFYHLLILITNWFIICANGFIIFFIIKYLLYSSFRSAAFHFVLLLFVYWAPCRYNVFKEISLINWICSKWLKIGIFCFKKQLPIIFFHNCRASEKRWGYFCRTKLDHSNFRSLC